MAAKSSTAPAKAPANPLAGNPLCACGHRRSQHRSPNTGSLKACTKRDGCEAFDLAPYVEPAPVKGRSRKAPVKPEDRPARQPKAKREPKPKAEPKPKREPKPKVVREPLTALQRREAGQRAWETRRSKESLDQRSSNDYHPGGGRPMFSPEERDNIPDGSVLGANYKGERYRVRVNVSPEGRRTYTVLDGENAGKDYTSTSAATLAITGKWGGGWHFFLDYDEKMPDPKLRRTRDPNAPRRRKPGRRQFALFQRLMPDIAESEDAPNGRIRWFCNHDECFEEFQTETTEYPESCPKGHAPQREEEPEPVRQDQDVPVEPEPVDEVTEAVTNIETLEVVADEAEEVEVPVA